MLFVVTGAQGYVGTRVVRAFADRGDKVVAIDLLKAPSNRQANVTWVQSDLAAPSNLTQVVKGEDYALVHLAWDMRRGAGYAVQAANLPILAGLLDEGIDAGLTRVVAFGSAEEYGCRSGVLAEHDAAQLPLSPYGWAKASAREMALSWSQNTGIPLTWMRPFIIYGPAQRGNLVIPYAVKQAAARECADFSDGLQERDFVYIDDVVDAVVRAATSAREGDAVLNIGSGEGVKVRDVLEAVACEMDGERLFSFGTRSRRPGEPDLQVADNRLACESLGWKPKTGWREGIRLTCREEMESS